MKARQCQRCGAPLPEADGPVTCAYCGMAYDPTSAFRPNVAVKLPPGAGRKLLWFVAAIVLIPVLGVALVTCGIFVTANKAIDTAKAGMTGRREGLKASILAAAKAKVKPSELVAGRGWQALDVAEPPGGAGNLDAVAAIPWAVSLAQAWRADARLERVDVEKVRPDGLVNARDDEAASVMYRFRSPALLEEQRRQMDLGKSDVQAGLFLEVKQGAVRALVTSVHDPREELPPHPASLPLKAIFESLGHAGKLPAKPFYGGYLIHLEREGWVWYLHTLARQDSIPRARASDGEAYPYR
ncbi:MAG: zinc ribbon domain-containing protein [Holophagaceae bacterium]